VSLPTWLVKHGEWPAANGAAPGQFAEEAGTRGQKSVRGRLWAGRGCLGYGDHRALKRRAIRSQPPPYEALHVVTGLGVGLINVMVFTMRAQLTPDHLLGRVGASVQQLVFGALALGALAGGLLAHHLGNRPSMWLTAILQIATIALLRPLWRPQANQPEPTPSKPPHPTNPTGDGDGQLAGRPTSPGTPGARAAVRAAGS